LSVRLVKVWLDVRRLGIALDEIFVLGGIALKKLSPSALTPQG